MFCNKWNKAGGRASWKNVSDMGPHEAGFLKLDTSKIKTKIGWKSRTGIGDAIDRIIEWVNVYNAHGDIPS